MNIDLGTLYVVRGKTVVKHIVDHFLLNSLIEDSHKHSVEFAFLFSAIDHGTYH